MSLNKEFLNRETNITAKVVADSISEQGKRITTFEIEYPRFIHSELMTHRMLSKNSSSSRAIPIAKMLDQIENNMAIPIYWGKNKSGMQAVEEVSKFDEVKSVLNWEKSYNYVKDRVLDMVELGLHKQVPNRLLEPFQMMKVVITGTEWDNFFNLRIHPDAQPEICKLAYEMYKALEKSEPQLLKAGEWHLPYVETINAVSGDENRPTKAYVNPNQLEFLTLEQAIKISAASCAAVSYRTNEMTLEKADKIFDMLIKAEVLHSSPFEHLATPITLGNANNNQIAYDVAMDNLISNNKGITHINVNGDYCSGNLVGWIQYRHTLNNNTCWKFDFEERMKMFDK